VDRLGFEADDIIAQYTRTTEGKIIILSSDKDFLQLLSPRVTQIRFSSSGTPTDFWDLERLEREIGATRMNYVHALALAGDKIDGIPGVPRFGIRTAVKQLAKCDWDIGRLLKEHEVASEHRDRVERNIALVDLLTPREDLMLPPLLPWKPTTAGDPAYEPLMNFILRYRLDSVKTKILSNTLWNA
jgi:DNA polymerase-1